MPHDDNPARLSLPESELPPEPIALPGEATVAPLAPRLGAAAGMGGGGFAGGGSGVGVPFFRPERSLIPDRSLGGRRALADRPLVRAGFFCCLICCLFCGLGWRFRVGCGAAGHARAHGAGALSGGYPGAAAAF